MRVKVLFFGLIRRYVTDKAEEVELPAGATLGDLVQELTRRHGSEFYENLINSDGSVKSEVFITLNGLNAASQEGLATRLAADAETHIVLVGPVVTGGAAGANWGRPF